MITPAYSPKSTTTAPDVYGALYDFVLAYGLSTDGALLGDNIYRGWQNRSALPPSTNDYAVITILDTAKRGTHTDEMVNTGIPPSEGEAYIIKAYYEVMAQIDFCGDTDAPRQRVYSIDSIFRSFVGTDFFSKYGITAQYGSGIRDMTFVDESSQFVLRYGLDLNLSYWAGVQVESAWFDNATLNKIVDVDTLK